jgi:hypothetical protein
MVSTVFSPQHLCFLKHGSPAKTLLCSITPPLHSQHLELHTTRAALVSSSQKNSPTSPGRTPAGHRAWSLTGLHARPPAARLLPRIIHQPEKSTRAGSFGTRKISTTTVSQAHDGVQTNASDCPGTVPLALIIASRRTAFCHPLGPLTIAAHVSHLGSRSSAPDLLAATHPGQQGYTASHNRRHWARRGQCTLDPLRALLHTGTEFAQAQLDRFHRR